MATCGKCGSTLVHFKNPDRDICPTPERHKVTSTLGRATHHGGSGRKKDPNKKDPKKK